MTSPRAWLIRCLGSQSISLESAREMDRGVGCNMWECRVEGQGVVLKVYSPGFDDYSELGPVDTARKHALALAEMPALGVPTPTALGSAQQGNEAALAMEHVEARPWQKGTRVEAARVLAALHSTPLTSLSTELAELVRRSRPNMGRVGSAPDEPREPEATLQHGDYFSANIAATDKGIRVLDWDLLALGDPMWDLGFLLEADRDVSEREADGAIKAYQSMRPVHEARLRWQRECWRAYWQRRAVGGQGSAH